MSAKEQATACSPCVEPAKPIRPKWALLIAKMFLLFIQFETWKEEIIRAYQRAAKE